MKYNTSNYRAIYGRLPNSNTYTKDYIQIPEPVSKELTNILRGSGDRVEIEYAWPDGGRHTGYFHWSTDRYHLSWPTNSPPPPWKLGDLADPVASIDGSTSTRSEAAADSQLAAIRGGGSNPRLFAIKLAGEPNRLHLRVYFENPPSERADRGLDRLPERLKAAVYALDASQAGTFFANWTTDAAPSSLGPERAVKLLRQIQSALTHSPNVLLVGPPGTGKSVALEELGAAYARPRPTSAVLFDPETWTGDWSQVDEPEARCLSLTFHASYTYENFVAGLLPKTTGSGISLEAVPGPLLCLSHWVGETQRQALLILDEFNRGSAASIFGDTLSLLDGDKRANESNRGSHIVRPYPEHEMRVPSSFCRGTGDPETVPEEVRLPARLHIVAAMNSSDRSVAPLDAALRRRFTVIRVLPDYALLSGHLGISIERAGQEPPMGFDIADWELDDVSALAVTLLRRVNERVEFCLGADFLLGHGLLWTIDANEPAGRLRQLCTCIDGLIVPTLRTAFVDQDETLAAVLGTPEHTQTDLSATTAAANTVAFWRIPPPELVSLVSKRLSLRPLHEMSESAQLGALVSIVSGA